MNNEKLIEFVREYPELYDMSHNKYSDNNRKEVIWAKIGEKLEQTGKLIYFYFYLCINIGIMKRLLHRKNPVLPFNTAAFGRKVIFIFFSYFKCRCRRTTSLFRNGCQITCYSMRFC